MFQESIRKVLRGMDLSESEMAETMGHMLSGNATSAQVGALVTALRIKGETVEEITGAARAMRKRTQRIPLNNHLVNIDRDEINVDEETILDTCGTGGDGTRTFNVSTATAFVAAGGGARVAKHGHRAVSSLCGSADVLMSLGVKLDINHSNVERCIQELGIGFLYAPFYQGAMKHVAGARRDIGVRTIFNLMGPLTNPAGATVQVLGVYSAELTEKMAHVLRNLGTREAFVVFGEGTFDEISICGPTRITHLAEGMTRTFTITPEDFGFASARLEDVQGGNARENGRIIRGILDGESGPKRDMVVLNAAAAFVASGLERDLAGGIQRAQDAIDSGKARAKLDEVIALTQQCGSFVRKEL
jgi:anthranilate phosphoribosyltransferase